jgi:hypothetical protein
MSTKTALAKKMIGSAVLFGALSVGTVGMAGQAFASTSTSTSGGSAQAHPQLCAQANQRKVRGRGEVAGFSKRMATTKSREAKAEAAGHHAYAAWLGKIAAHDQAIVNRAQKRLAANEAIVARDVARSCRAPHSTASKAAGGSSTSQS